MKLVFKLIGLTAVTFLLIAAGNTGGMDAGDKKICRERSNNFARENQKSRESAEVLEGMIVWHFF